MTAVTTTTIISYNNNNYQPFAASFNCVHTFGESLSLNMETYLLGHCSTSELVSLWHFRNSGNVHKHHDLRVARLLTYY